MRNEKLRGIGIIFFRADAYTGDIRDEIWCKENAKESNRDCKSYGIINLSFKIAVG